MKSNCKYKYRKKKYRMLAAFGDKKKINNLKKETTLQKQKKKVRPHSLFRSVRKLKALTRNRTQTWNISTSALIYRRLYPPIHCLYLFFPLQRSGTPCAMYSDNISISRLETLPSSLSKWFLCNPIGWLNSTPNAFDIQKLRAIETAIISFYDAVMGQKEMGILSWGAKYSMNLKGSYQ